METHSGLYYLYDSVVGFVDLFTYRIPFAVNSGINGGECAYYTMGAEGLITAGFVYIGTCNCGGGVNRKYKKGDWLVYLGSRKFKVKYNGTTVRGYENISSLETFIQATFPVISA